MSQSYFPSAGKQAPLVEEPDNIPHAESQLKDAEHSYLEHKDRLLRALDSSKAILGDLRAFNKDAWVVRYPQFRNKSELAPEAASEPSPRRRGVRRSLSFADEPERETDVVVDSLSRSQTVSNLSDVQEEQASTGEGADVDTDGERLIPPSDASDFHVFRLDLKLGAHGPAELVSQLERSSIANLLDERMAASMHHVDRLRVRVEDTSSKVLVTGDLNAGKSTLVNALIQREVMPVDQQPCTTAFCEVHDSAENGGVEEVHVVKDGVAYDVADEATFDRVPLADLEALVAENESSERVLKLYLKDTRAPNQSLLNNGIADISLIDAPGLNRDSIKTTALFARQEEIDVVVFVVSAENHFTLSAREFLWNASKEKAYLFIVVNKFEQIKNKEKCKRLVLEQIQEFSPRTFDDAEDLVHFVDSAHGTDSAAFENMESALRSFVLVKRAKSKLNPVSNYLSHLLTDVDLLVGANAIVAQNELSRALDDLNRARPILEKMKSCRELLEDTLEVIEEEGARTAASDTKQSLLAALEQVGQGLSASDVIQMPSYPGFLNIWDYARDVRKALLSSLDAVVLAAEDHARVVTSGGVTKITQLGDEHLPEGVERNRRVFMPEAMFSPRAAKTSRRRGRRSSIGTAIVAGGTLGLGIGLAQRSELLEPTFLDLFDVHHQLWAHFGPEKDDCEEAGPTALGVVSVGLGALTMVGGQAVGARGIIEGVVRVSDLLGNDSARKWAAPVVGACVVGAVAYFILELPNTIPRTVGRRIRRSLTKAGDGRDINEESSFVGAQATRVSRETRKVLRLASWDLKERFRGAMEESGKEVQGAEEMERKAERAVEWFKEVRARTTGVREEAGLVRLA
ncbi:transmembrane GTPase fzo1 [Amylostereum chailletii]|nr:transmembrane GTPase fzo1 [Amylostereum chailletii]